MLARLDEIPGVSRSRAECSGHYILVELVENVPDGIAIREEMFQHVERIYAGLAPAGRFFETWPRIAAQVAERCARWLERERVTHLLATTMMPLASC